MKRSKLNTTEYQRRLHDAIERKKQLNNEIEFLKLQIKQESKQKKWAKGSVFIKAFVKQWPNAEVENGAGVTYLTLKLDVLQPDHNPHIPGWVHFESEPINRNNIGSPIIHKYRYPEMPVLLYVTRDVR